MCNRLKSWICFCWFSPLLSCLVTLYSAKMSLVTSINCRVSRRWGQSWWAEGLLEHHSQATVLSPNKCFCFSQPQVFCKLWILLLLWTNYGIAMIHLICCPLPEGKVLMIKRCIRVCSWPAKEPYAITRVELIQYYQHMFDSVLQWLPTQKSCQTLSLNHLQGQSESQTEHRSSHRCQLCHLTTSRSNCNHPAV